jgi:hypothetical protein
MDLSRIFFSNPSWWQGNILFAHIHVYTLFTTPVHVTSQTCEPSDAYGSSTIVAADGLISSSKIMCVGSRNSGVSDRHNQYS